MTTPFDRDKWDRRFLKIARDVATCPGDHTPTCAPADRPQTRQAGRRCFDHACPVSEACPLYQRRHGPLYAPWRVAGAMAGNTVTGYVPWRGGKQATIR